MTKLSSWLRYWVQAVILETVQVDLAEQKYTKPCVIPENICISDHLLSTDYNFVCSADICLSSSCMNNGSCAVNRSIGYFCIYQPGY